MIIGLKRKTKVIFTTLTIIPILLVGAVYLIQPAQGATCNWTGGSGSWETGANWSCGAAPTNADDAVIDANVTVTINATTTINSLTLGNSGGTTSPTLNFAYDAVANSALILDDGNLATYSGSDITHSDAGSSIVGKVNIDVQTGNATIGGDITLDVKGYTQGNGTGGGTVGDYRDGPGGGGHGGEGGNGESGYLGGISHGSVSQPTDLGSGGGYGGWSTSYGGDGGGAVKLSAASGTITINGTVSSDGGNGSYVNNDHSGAGGAGGSIYLIASTFAGSGALSADGGDGAGGGYAFGGGGAGGRISIEYTSKTFSGTITTLGGSATSTAEAGAAGTIHEKPSTQTYGNLTIDNGSQTNYSGTTMSSETLHNVTISNAYISHRRNSTSELYKLDLTIENDLTIDSDASINANSRGLTNDSGSGNGGEGDYQDGSGGAAFGGEGGKGESGRLGGYTYGDPHAPDSLGSGGGRSSDGSGAQGGTGGGAIKLTVNGTITINGSVSSDGGTGKTQDSNHAGGGGSGGSIYIITNTFAGSGTIQSNGGTGGNNSNADGGGGGGGRIAFNYATKTFSGTIQAYGGSGPDNAQDGGAGTIVQKPSSQTYGNITIDNGTSTDYGHTTFTTETFHDVAITNASLSHRQNYTTETYKLDLTLQGSLTVNASGYIDTNYRGYQYSAGPGEGTDGDHGQPAAGGGYGGEGGIGRTGRIGGYPYGDISNPTSIGSGGGNGGYSSSANGGYGGGAIKLTITGTATVNGAIRANGANGGVLDNNRIGGGGAAGSIIIIADTISGSGTIQANGGDGGDVSSNDAGAGGGGRIALEYNTKTFSGDLEAYGGDGHENGQEGGAGTICEKPSGQTYCNLILDNDSSWTSYAPTVIESGTFENITINNAILGHRRNYATESYNIDIVVNNHMTINSNGSVSTNGRGFQSATGTGSGSGGNHNSGAGGAGYGGDGNDGNSGAAGGSTYGSLTAPTSIGSGGGNGGYSSQANGGYGAGATKLTISGTLTVDGEISANGDVGGAYSGCGRAGGGGSGGSLWLIIDTLAGSGTIEATGGDGGNSCGSAIGGGGGGGRIAIEYITANNWSGNTLNSAGATPQGTGGSNGSDGTLSLNQLSSGYVTNLDSGLNSYQTIDWSTDMEQSGNAAAGYKGLGITDTANKRIAEFTAKIDGNLDWTSIDADIDTTTYKSYFHVPSGFSNMDGYDASYPTYTLYIPKGTGTRVGICPGVSTLNDVNASCSSLTYYYQSDSNVEVVSMGGTTYWKVSGLTSTGGFSSVDNITDTMSRLQVSAASDHEIEFTTANGIDANTDTITVEFDPSAQSWNLGSITLSDIDLEDDGTDVTLAASAAAGTWGVNINTTTDIITFTAPTDAGSGEVADDSVITIKIGTNADGGSNQIVNPATAGEYEIEVRMNTANDEYGFVEIAIVDDDTINVTSYIDSFILFDIDTSETDEDCDAAGGTSPCDSHSGSTDDSGYTVDLGEMSILTINESGDTVMHADGVSGDINYIYFDLSTNASSGAAVTLISTNGALNGSGANTIPSVTNDGDGVTISAGDGAYGIREVSNSATTGSFTIAGDYDGGVSVFGECTTSATQIFSTTSAPIDTGRLQMAIGASPDSSDGTGTYTDTLTFIVTSTF